MNKSLSTEVIDKTIMYIKTHYPEANIYAVEDIVSLAMRNECSDCEIKTLVEDYMHR